MAERAPVSHFLDYLDPDHAPSSSVGIEVAP
jgi:hypothetical protein